MIQGINHITLAVQCLQESKDFYITLLGCQPVVFWDEGAYLLAGNLWLTLICDKNFQTQVRPEYTHIAFSVSDQAFDTLKARITENKIAIWKENRSEGASLYFLDPNGHKLEIHVGHLQERINSIRQNPLPGYEIIMESEIQ